MTGKFNPGDSGGIACTRNCTRQAEQRGVLKCNERLRQNPYEITSRHAPFSATLESCYSRSAVPFPSVNPEIPRNEVSSLDTP